MDKAFLLRLLVAKYHYKSYLEIGCRHDTTYKQIDVPRKVGVDPVSGGTFRGTSDEFFSANKDKFDLIFVDGLHEHEQVLRDVRNGLDTLNSNGTIVLHDCLPKDAAAAAYPQGSAPFWNGTVYRAVAQLRCDPSIDVVTLDADWGLAVVRQRPNTDLLTSLPSTPLTFADYLSERDEIMRVVCSLDVLNDWLDKDVDV